MSVFRKLWQSIEALAAGLNVLAATVDAFNQEVRQRTGLSAEDNVPLLTDLNGKDEPAALPSGRKRR
jgi:hypothetical protein